MKRGKKVLSSFLFLFPLPIFHLRFLFFLSYLFPIGQQKFHGRKSLGGTLPPLPPPVTPLGGMCPPDIFEKNDKPGGTHLEKGYGDVWPLRPPGKSILQVPDTGTQVLANTRPFLHSSIVSFWITPACSKGHKYHIFRQYWYTRNVPVFTNSGTFQYLGPEVYFFQTPPFHALSAVP